MAPWLPRLLAHTPPVVKRQALLQLFRATAAAYRCEMPRLGGLSREACLEAYARFTADRAEGALRGEGDPSELHARLYKNAYHLGRRVRRWLHLRRNEDVLAVASFLYSILDIEFQGSAGGEITIGRCYFSSYYSPQVCRLMSAMDRGLLAGLSGGRELVFSGRISEGQPFCSAHLSPASGLGVTGRLQEQNR